MKKFTGNATRLLVRFLTEEMQQLSLPGIEHRAPPMKWGKTKMEELKKMLVDAYAELRDAEDNYRDVRRGHQGFGIEPGVLEDAQRQVRGAREEVQRVEHEIIHLKAASAEEQRAAYGGDPSKNPRGLGT